MTTTLRLQYTSVRTRDLDGQVLIGLKHTARDATELPIKTPWIEMTPDDTASLVKTLQEALAQLPSQTCDDRNGGNP